MNGKLNGHARVEDNGKKAEYGLFVEGEFKKNIKEKEFNKSKANYE